MDPAAHARLAEWKQSLLDPTDRLLDAADHGVPIATDPVRLAFRLAAGSTVPVMTGAPGIALSATELARRLGELTRAARDAACEDEHALHVALGELAWTDARGLAHVSPLVLWPVELAGSELVAARGLVPRPNELLLARLAADHGLSLAAGDPLDVAALLDAAAEAAGARTGWRLDRAARLGTWSLAAFELWRDLDVLGDALAARGPVAWLAGGAPAPALPPAAPAEPLAPLAADASQLAAISAAGAGASFVLAGAPGAGKSQTIANLLVHCASHGKTVLFVSDRVAVLDTVHQRLAGLGLAEFCMALYGEHGGRERVIEGLARALERTFRPGSGPSTPASRLDELRAALDRHAGALHAIGPLGMSMHAVLGRLVELRTTPCAALAEADASMLEASGFARRLAAVAALAETAALVEPVAQHPWRAAAPEAWSEGAPERAARALATAAAAADELAAAVAAVTALIPGVFARTPDELRALGALADLAAATPRAGAELLTMLRAAREDEVGERVGMIRARGGGELDVPRDPAELIAIAHRHRALAAEVAECFTEDVELLEAAELWGQLKRWTTSLAPLRYVALRAARAEVRRVARPGALADDAAMVMALEAVIAERACREALRAAEQPARRWFGELAGDPLALDLARIEAAMTWATELRRACDRIAVARGETGRQTAWRALVAIVSAGPAEGTTAAELQPFARLADAVARWEPALAELATATGLAPAALGAGRDHLSSLRDQLAALGAAGGTLDAWARFHLARRDARIAGIGPAIDAIERGDLAAAELAPAWERATLLAWTQAELRATPALAAFDGAAHHARVAEHADLDRRSLAVARQRAIARLAERVPRVLGAADVDPRIAALRRERAAVPGSPLRAVLAETAELWPRLAPCVLATPHAIARYLDPGLPAFDLVVFDEASQLAVARALPALARAGAVVIAGDARHPVPADGREGLLAAALGAGLPELALHAHYRSRHHELFAFANERYYADALEVVPAAHRGDRASPLGSPLGIDWRRVDGAPDDSGANAVEAEAVAAEVVRRAAEGRSIAVIAMARAQAELVAELIARARDADPALEAALAAAPEPLLVGTPDRLQGEERDVALISIGGVPDALGALAQPGSERWLAVAITRARQQWIAWSSFAPDAIAADAPAAARELAALLEHARGAGEAPAEREPASAITAAVGRALAERGWTVRHQVGVGPYRIDLAVVDPEDPTRHVLAIEHDGGAYARAPFARDRDRVRAELLAERGWRVHRIWSLDWWRDAEREIQRAHGAIVAAVAANRQKRAPAPARSRVARGSAPVQAPLADTTPVAVASASRGLAAGSGPAGSGSGPAALPAEITTPVVRIPRGAIAIGPYTAAAIPAGRRTPDDLFSPRHEGELGKIVEQVLAAEAPVHLELLARRAAAYFGIGRIDARVLDQIRAALAGRGRFGDEQGIVWRADQDPASVPAVRVAGANGAARRDIAEVPLSELAAAARVVVERAHELGASELVRGCARLLGFGRLTDQVSERVALGIQLAAARQLIALEDGKARLPA